MCGIAGIAGTAGLQAPEALVKRMTDAIAHRGPNAEGVWRDGDVVLGHRRLSIIDLSPESHQPFHGTDGRYSIAFNGEIYNYRLLRKELEATYAFRTASDTEVLLAAFATWGIACLDRLEGMFAFALWDHRERSLYLVRDRMGIKPLYLWQQDGHLLFASEVRALLATGLVPRQLDSDALVDHLRYQTVHAPATLLKDVRMLMPGHWLRWQEGRITEQCYWNPVANARKDLANVTAPEAQAQVRELLGAAVKKRLVSDVPFGAFLSGGIDSSAVVALMAQASAQPVHTFSVVFDEERFSEERYAHLVAEKYGTRHTAIRLRPEDMLRLLPDALAAMDHPSADGPNTFVVSKVTKEAGITMALSGLGGDEIFAGYEVFPRSLRLMERNALTALPASLRKAGGHLLAALRPSAGMDKAVELLGGPSFRLEHTYPLSRAVFTDPQVRELLHGRPLPPNAVQAIVHRLLDREGGNTLPVLSQISLAELATYLQNVLLRDTDQMSMAHALEVRVPFLDHGLVEYVLGVPDRLKYPHTPKPLLVQAMGDLLPREVVDRPKMGFTLPWADWMRGALKTFCAERLVALPERAPLSDAAVQHLWRRFLAGDPRMPWSRIWHLVVLADWLERNEVG
ncbi:MAG: asparagine synthase (glutamine-hydrolyzing) [Flavobacteriales bacterium]